jgi:hypothetical protein
MEKQPSRKALTEKIAALEANLRKAQQDLKRESARQSLVSAGRPGGEGRVSPAKSVGSRRPRHCLQRLLQRSGDGQLCPLRISRRGKKPYLVQEMNRVLNEVCAYRPSPSVFGNGARAGKGRSIPSWQAPYSSQPPVRRGFSSCHRLSDGSSRPVGPASGPSWRC